MRIRTALSAMIVFGLLGIVTSCNAETRSQGVTQIEEAQITGSLNGTTRLVPTEPQNGSTLSDEHMDEQVATHFAVCIRDQGLNIKDPELNADGSVNMREIKEDLGRYGDQDAKKALEDCLPMLEGATFSKESGKEDEIELEDNLLEFAQCLRENGVDVPDPRNSKDDRLGKNVMFEGLKGADSRVQRSVDMCTGRIWGVGQSGK